MRPRLFLTLLLVPLGFLDAQPAMPEPIPPLLARQAESGDFPGNWLRHDGQYRLVLEFPEGGDEIEAAYFNPEPIHVESTLLEMVEGTWFLTVVLRDEGYPGSTYRLSYDTSRRILIGTYTRPGSRPSEVGFVRQEDPLE